jgi:hypothetical protein
MRHLSWLTCLLLSAVLTTAQTKPEKIKILLLGTFHFGYTSDNKKTDFPDLFSPARQRQLDAMAQQLVKFGVNKFFLETDFRNQHRDDSLFALYQAGKLTDSNALRDERVQIAYRTARINKAKLVASDNRQPLPYDSVDRFAKLSEKDTTPTPVFFKKTPYPFTQKLSKLAVTSLPEYYKQINNRYSREKSQYDFLHYSLSYGYGDNFTGEYFTLSWYDRNLKIFNNILRGLDPDTDKKIVVLYGSSHTALLRQFFENHPAFEIVEVDSVL